MIHRSLLSFLLAFLSIAPALAQPSEPPANAATGLGVEQSFLADENLTGSSVRRTKSVQGDGIAMFVRIEGTRLVAVRVSTPGVILDTTPILIASDAIGIPAVGWDGVNFLIAWGDGAHLRGARVSRYGELIDPQGFEIVDTDSREVALSFGAGRYLVVWPDGDLRGLRLDRDGSVSSETFKIAPDLKFPSEMFFESFRSISVAWNGAMFLVVWNAQLPEAGPFCVIGGCRAWSARAARVFADNEVLDQVPIEISKGRTDEDVAVASDGRDFLVVWIEQPILMYPVVMVAHVEESGVVNSSWPTNQLGRGESPSIVWNGHAYLVAWQSGRFLRELAPGSSESDIFFTRLDRRGIPLDGGGAFALARSPEWEQWPALVAGGTTVNAVFESGHPWMATTLRLRTFDTANLPELPAAPTNVTKSPLPDRGLLLSWRDDTPDAEHYAFEFRSASGEPFGGNDEIWVPAESFGTSPVKSNIWRLPSDARIRIRVVTATGISAYSELPVAMPLLRRALRR